MLDCAAVFVRSVALRSGIRPLGGIVQRSSSARWWCAKIGPIDEHHDDDSDDDKDDDDSDDDSDDDEGQQRT